MSGNLFLDGIFNGGSTPNKVQLYLPEWNATTGKSLTADPSNNAPTLVGLLASEFTLSTQNKWGPLLQYVSEVNELTAISTIMGDNELFSWIGASVQCWKGTDPLKFSLDFYLINYTKGLSLEKKIAKLVKLTSLSAASGSVMSNVKVVPHGGYKSDVLSTNKSMFNNSGWSNFSNSSFSSLGEDVVGGVATDMESYGRNLWAGDTIQEGTITMVIGSKITIANLLVGRVDVTPSLVEVATQDGGDPKPLYYRVSASFTGTKPLLSADVDSIYGDI